MKHIFIQLSFCYLFIRLGIKYNGRFVSILISHVGIDSKVLREIACSEQVNNKVEMLKKKYSNKRMIIGVDDIDIVKGPLLKLQAFHYFLNTYPQYIEQIVFIQMLLPSKNSLIDNTETGTNIHSILLNEINTIKTKFGQDIIHVIEPNNGVNLMELVSFYNAAEIAVVSTFWDGLNLMPFEYTVSQNNNCPGVLIISEFMGCSRALNGVLRVNPWSLEMVSEAIHTALAMSMEERKANHARRFNYVMNHSIETWAKSFLLQLENATKLGQQTLETQVKLNITIDVLMFYFVADLFVCFC
jgi:trehalose 6-phosphate synthase/phosphatase